MKKPEKEIRPPTEAEEAQGDEVQDEELEDVTGGALDLTGTATTADLRSIRLSKRPGRIKKVP